MIDLEDDIPTPMKPPVPPSPAPKAKPKPPTGKLPYVPAEAPGPVPPHSVEAEEQLLSACFLDGGGAVQLCIEERVSPDSLYVPANRVIYERLLEMHAAGKPIDLAVLAEELKTTRQLDEIGGYAYLTRVAGRVPTTAGLTYFIEKVRELEILRTFIRESTRSVENSYNYTGGLDEFLRAQEARLSAIWRAGRAAEEFKPKGVFDFTYPEDDDPNALLGGDDWLGRGGGMLFVSHAGAGKSSLILDACLDWTQGLPFMNIASKGKHKILVVQSEDSDRYLGKIVTSYRAHRKLTDAQCLEISERFVVVQVKGVSGVAFLTALQGLIAKHQPDIVVINPVYLYIDGDVSDSKETKLFLNGLDAINAKGGNRLAWILVHHTGKPPREEQRESMDWETAYAGIGSSVWANWPRCSMLLEPRKDAKGRFWLRLGKAGANAGVVREDVVGGQTVRESVTKLPIRHSARLLQIGARSRPMILWEEDLDGEAESPDGSPKGRGGKSPWSQEEIVSYYPDSNSEGEKLAVIARRAREGTGISEPTFFRMRAVLLKSGWIAQVPGGGVRRTSIGDDFARSHNFRN